ncbi:MAG: 1-acyl-sn-glycerol-3-phosphate acyltransferase [Oscillospiraceae bacterium]|nr:1-acyl-sn-glycerol-3-phosphate acyltransferase [Oscillospiraceae bacterium]
MRYSKPNIFCYRLTQVIAWIAAVLVFRRKIIRNEIKDQKGPFVVIANHQTALDFVNLIGATARPMTFVISKSIFSTLPIKGFIEKLGMIPKQQFQTAVRDMKRIKSVIDNGQGLVIYPAGLMCEDGLSTPIPAATYRFLQWLGADVYVARCSGTYFVMPKWSAAIRPGRTYMDIYKLFSKEELAAADLETLRKKTDEALLFDAYREQEKHMVKYLGNRNIEGLENVLYMCPHCMSEFSVEAKNGVGLRCGHCGYEVVGDEYAFLHRRSEHGPEIKYVSDWSRFIYDKLKKRVQLGSENSISANVEIHMIDHGRKKFSPVGLGMVSLSRDGFVIDGVMHGERTELNVSIVNVPTLPFGPGRYFEIQDGEKIYRCYPEDGRKVMKFINMLKIFYELSAEKAAAKNA